MSDELQQTLKKKKTTYDQARANHCLVRQIFGHKGTLFKK